MKIFLKSGSYIFTAFLPLIILLTIVFGTMLFGSKSSNATSEDITDGWVTESGEMISSAHLPKGNITITHSLSDFDTEGKSLCFKSSNTDITVLFDGVPAYEYRFVPSSALVGRSYGMRMNMVAIPDDASSVTLTAEPLYDSVAAGLSMISVENSGKFLNSIYQNGIPSFSLCMLLVLYGGLMITVGLLTRGTAESSNVDFFSLGAFAILTGVYSSNETLVLQIFTERADVVRFCAAVSLMFISYFPLSFIASVTHRRDTILLPILLSLNILNFIVTVVLSLLDISDVALMLPFSHINIVLAVVMTGYLMYRAVKKEKDNKAFIHTVVTGMSSALAGAGIDLLRYTFMSDRKLGNSLFTRAGVLIFVVLMGIHLMKERTRLAVEKERSELMEKLAYTDALTGLKNRAAFRIKENEIRTGHIGCIIVQLDINDLKKVNDVYGHAEGDRHIIGAAEIILNSFSDIGTSYRTGGDEFIVITHSGGIPEVESALKMIEEKSSAYNKAEKPPVPLSIAYGYALCTAQEDALETAENLADQRMYEKKQQMKAARAS